MSREGTRQSKHEIKLVSSSLLRGETRARMAIKKLIMARHGMRADVELVIPW